MCWASISTVGLPPYNENFWRLNLLLLVYGKHCTKRSRQKVCKDVKTSTKLCGEEMRPMFFWKLTIATPGVKTCIDALLSMPSAPHSSDLPNRTYQTKSNYQAYWTKPTKPKLLVKAVNAWVRSAFGNVYSLSVCLWFPVYIHVKYTCHRKVLLSLSGDLGIGLVWDNLSLPHRTTFRSECWNPLQTELKYLWWVLSCYQDDIRWFEMFSDVLSCFPMFSAGL